MATRIALRRDSTANWTLANPVLEDGEPGLDSTLDQLKIGDGVTPWLDLPFLTNGAGAGGGTGTDNDTLPTIANIASITRQETAPGVYPPRGTSRTDICIYWKGTVPPPIAASGSGTNFLTSATAMAGVDMLLRQST